MYKDLNILVLGFARSGYDAAKLLVEHNNKVTVNDYSDRSKSNEEHIISLEKVGVEFIFGGHPDYLLDNNFDLIVKNPGISMGNPVIKEALKKNIPITTELDVAFTYFPKGVKVIAITGSNGKTTTTEILYKSLEKYSSNVILAGNIGIATSGIVKDLTKDSIIVVEVSVQQLVNLNHFKPDITIFTNLSEAHLDTYKTYDNYKNIKLRIFDNNDDNSLSIINYDDEEVLNRTKDVKGTIKYFSVNDKKDAYLLDSELHIDGDPILNTNDILIKGNHNYLNILSAMLVFKELNIDYKYLKEFLKEFKGYPHRLEYVDNINERIFYNDSKSTNMKSLETALTTFDSPTILIIGGQDRLQDFDVLLPFMGNVKRVITFGEVNNRAYAYFKDKNFEVDMFDLLKDATKHSYKVSSKNDVILLSPGSGSWDYYKNFEERGEDFKNTIKEIENGIKN